MSTKRVGVGKDREIEGQMSAGIRKRSFILGAVGNYSKVQSRGGAQIFIYLQCSG